MEGVPAPGHPLFQAPMRFLLVADELGPAAAFRTLNKAPNALLDSSLATSLLSPKACLSAAQGSWCGNHC